MSGDSGGIILGLIAAPIVLAGAAAAGVAYGAFKIGEFLVKSAISYAKKKAADKALVVNNCSADLEAMYQQMQQVVLQQAKSYEKLTAATQKKLNDATKDMHKLAQTADLDVELMNQQLAQSHAVIAANLNAHADAARKDIVQQGQTQLNACADALQKAQDTRANLAVWKQAGAAAKAEQKALAYAALRDAKASLALMENLLKDYPMAAFSERCKALKEAYTAANSSYELEAYETAYTGFSAITRQVAMEVSAQQMAQMELDFAAMQLQARVSGLESELAQRRYMAYSAEGDDHVYDEDLDEFSQGELAKVQQAVQALRLKAASPTARYQIQKLNRECEQLEARAQQVLTVAQQVLLGYHEKLKLMNVIQTFMESQNFTTEWAAPVGGDPSQKLVVNFSNTVSGSTVSVTLDSNASTGDISRMALELLTFYDNGKPVTEAEKKALRDQLNAALADAGFAGATTCTGRVNQPSAQTQMSTEDGVLKEQVRKLL